MSGSEEPAKTGVADLVRWVEAGVISHQKAIALYSTLYERELQLGIAPEMMLPCEDCGMVIPLGNMVSYKIWTPMAGHPLVSGYDEHDQHFCCSQDCAERQAINCIRNHLRPEAEARCALARSRSGTH